MLFDLLPTHAKQQPVPRMMQTRPQAYCKLDQNFKFVQKKFEAAAMPQDTQPLGLICGFELGQKTLNWVKKHYEKRDIFNKQQPVLRMVQTRPQACCKLDQKSTYILFKKWEKTIILLLYSNTFCPVTVCGIGNLIIPCFCNFRKHIIFSKA